MDSQQPMATFQIPVAYPPELLDLTKDLRNLQEKLREEIEFYRAQREKNTFSEKEAAEFFGISVKSLRELRNAGKISYTPVKGQFFYTRRNLEDYVENQQVTANKGRK